jgi:hypothetical protein
LFQTKTNIYDHGVDLDIDVTWTGHSSAEDTVANVTGSAPFEPILRDYLDWDANQYGQSSFLDIGLHEDIAITQAHANVSAADVQALVSAAEAKKTVQTVTSILKRASKFALAGVALKKRMARGALKGKALKNAWLELRYGIRPLYYELKGVIDAYFKYGRPPRLRFSGHSEDEDTTEQVINMTQPAIFNGQDWDSVAWPIVHVPYSSGIYTLVKQETNSVTCDAGVLVEALLDVNNLEQVLGLDEGLQAAWELVPWSFVIDFFVNVGSTIAAWAPKGDVKYLTSWVVTRLKTVTLYTLTEYTSNQAAIGGYSTVDTVVNDLSGVLEVTRTRTIRTANPPLSAIPSLDINLDVAKIVDLLALFTRK